MGPVHTAIVEAIKAIAEPCGASVEYSTGSKHSFAYVRKGGTFRKLTMSNGSKNVKHQIAWAQQAARRAIREMAQGKDRNGGEG